MKHLFIFSAFFLLALYGKSQQSFGLKLGMNTSWQARDSVGQAITKSERAKSLVGLQIGWWWRQQFGKQWSTLLGVNYLQTGSRTTLLMNENVIQRFEADDNHFTERSAYIDIPVFIQWESKRISISAGPSVGLWLFTNMKAPDGYRYGGPKYRSVNWSGNVAAQVKLSKKFGLQMRYQHGFSNVYPDVSPMQAKNRSFQSSLTYQLFAGNN